MAKSSTTTLIASTILASNFTRQHVNTQIPYIVIIFI